MMKRFILLLLLVALVAAGCDKVQLKTSPPDSPAASYQDLPK